MERSPLPPGHSTYIAASFSFINAIAGTSIVAVPYALSQCGLIGGIFFLTFVAWLVHHSYLILIKCGIKAQKYNLEDIVGYYLGDNGYYAVVILMFLFSFGAQVSELVVVGDTMPIVVQLILKSTLPDRTLVTILLASVFVLPICLLRNLSSLSWTSMLSVLSTNILIIILTVMCPYQARMNDLDQSITLINPNMFAGIGTFSLAFVCHHNSFLMFKSLQEQTYANWTRVVNLSVGVSYTLCLLFGLVAYLSFGVNTKGDLLNNFPSSSLPVNVSRVLVGVTMLLSVPVDCYVSRHCLHSLIERFRSRSNETLTEIVETGIPLLSGSSNQHISYNQSNKFNVHEVMPANTLLDCENVSEFVEEQSSAGYSFGTYDHRAIDISTFEHVTLTIILWGSTLFISVCIEDLGVVMGITGALCASLVGYVVPAVIYLQAHKNENGGNCCQVGNVNGWIHTINTQSQFYIPWFMIVFGFVAAFTGVGTVMFPIS